MSKKHNTGAISLSRRSLLKGSVGIASGVMGSALLGTSQAAESTHENLGNYPEGVSGENVLVGITVPQTGAYSPQGSALTKGYELAIDHLNKGGGLVDTIDSLDGNGVLGKKVTYDIGDSETSPNSAIQVLSRQIRDKKAIVITGSVSSAVAVAAEELAQREHVVYMCGESTSNETTGASRRRYGFRSQVSAYMLAKALAPTLAENLGKNRKAIYLLPDYTYGHSMFESTSRFNETEGWTTVGKQVFPTGTSDFSSYLLNIANSDADVLVNIAYGSDQVNSIKQAKNYGILDKMTLVCPLIADFTAESVGSKLMQGVYGSVDFWWSMADQDPIAARFVKSFEQRFGKKPSWGSELAYSQMMLWADAVERSKTFYPPATIKALESGHELRLPMGKGYYRACDHQLVRRVPILKGKKPGEKNNSQDYFEIVGFMSGKEAVPPCDLFPGKLGKYK